MPKDVKIYSTPSCPYCMRTKQFLKDNNISFQDFDVSNDESKAKEMTEKSGQMGVPVIDIEGKIVVGFDKEAISSALGL
jgi:glutaredoxin-like YruB-family protein